MIDWERFNEEFVQYFDKAVVIQIIDIFVAECETRLADIEKSITLLDFAGIKAGAHDLKSLSGNFRAPEPEELARKLEIMAIDNKDQGLMEVFLKLKPAAIELMHELISYKKTLVP
jgi:HPt (histidine-containing phosphotransfer) domain-containing protein